MVTILVPLSEFLDRFSVISIKLERIKDENKIKIINEEFSRLISVINMYELNHLLLTPQYFKIKEINEKLWDLEDDVRTLIKNNQYDELYIRVTKEIHATNNQRVKAKNEIDLFNGEEVKEIKSYEV
jgi:hypothetical protein